MNKKEIKRLILKVFLLAEVCVFGYTYLFGSNGLKYLMVVKEENEVGYNQISDLKNEIEKLQEQINQLNNDIFYKEKIARENLQMARSNEQIYYIV